MSLSILFSGAIYLVVSNELKARLTNFQTNVEETLELTQAPSLNSIIHATDDLMVSDKLVADLLYVNIFVLIGGGFISYFLARRNLIPIKKLHEAQSRFTSDASHELRTPLAVMKTELEVALRDDNATIDNLKEVLSSNLEEVGKLSKLAEMLLSLSQLDNTKLKLGPVNLDKATRGIISDLKQPKKRIELSSKKQQIVYGNEMALLDLVKVLIDNSIQYSPKGSIIRIIISKHDDNYAKFEITNIGPGIKPDKLPYIFDRFYRADTSRTNGNNKGLGLGLSLANNIVELHNGSLSASSIPGVDTTFTLLLPLNSSVQNRK